MIGAIEFDSFGELYHQITWGAPPGRRRGVRSTLLQVDGVALITWLSLITGITGITVIPGSLGLLVSL